MSGTRDTMISTDNSNVNQIHGSGTITNNNLVYIDARPPARFVSYVSDLSVSASLPAKPIVFHGRDDFVNDSVQLVTASGSGRIAILGPGGMGKTIIALAMLYDSRVVKRFEGGRLFLSCEALVDADAIVVSLAKLLRLPASEDLLAAVITRLTAIPRVFLVLDNLETVWLAGGTPVAAVDELLGRLAQIPALSLIITCRGTILPQFVEWSNAEAAALEPFSLEAALKTFQDRAGRRLTEEDEDLAKQLINAVDRMPLAVALLGQLVRRGNLVPELLDRWNREHSALLRTHGAGRINNVEVSIELSIAMLIAADASQESMQLLSLCCMLPDGLRPAVFGRLRLQFKHIDRARDNLSAYALASMSVDRVLRTLSPIRHLVLDRHPAQSSFRDALYAIYFDIVAELPVVVNEHVKELAAAAALEMGNLSSLLLTLVPKPSQRIIDGVIHFTRFAYLQQPTMTVASALLSYLGPYSNWKARCLQVIGETQSVLGDYRSAIESLTKAAWLFLEVGDQLGVASCKQAAGDSYRLLGEYNLAETLTVEARATHVRLGDRLGDAQCRVSLARLMRRKRDYPAAIGHLSAARQIFESSQMTYEVSMCSEALGIVYLSQRSLDAAAAELEVTYATFIRLGHHQHAAQSSRFLGVARRRQGDFNLSEQFLGEAEALNKANGSRFGLAECAWEFGCLRRDQGRREEAVAHLNSAKRLYETLQLQRQVDECREFIERLESTVLVIRTESMR